MNTFVPSLFLRRALLLDAAATFATGVLLCAGADLLERWMRLPAALSLYAGLTLLPFAAFVAWLAKRERVSGAAVWAVIVINAAWVVESLWLAAAGPVALNALGQGFVVAQALAVGGFAELEFFGLRRSRRAQSARA
jgi:hypothetical protein